MVALSGPGWHPVRKALRGIRVLDFTRLAPGPFCTRLLRQMGAEVIKIEEPGHGDPLRRLARSAFENLNAGKKSLAVNLKKAGGREVLFRLAERADVLVEGFRPGVMARLGLSYEELQPRCPRLVYLSLTGYGQEGPHRARAGHDVNYMAAAGALGTELPRVQVADFGGGGLFAALLTVSALLARRDSDRGAFIDWSMLEGVRWLMGISTSPLGDLLSGAYPCYGLYRTSDGGALAVGALEPKFWEAFCGAIGRSDLEGRANDQAARDEIAALVAKSTVSDWSQRFAAVDACVEPLPPPGTPFRHPQLDYLASRSARPTEALEAAPELGEHTRRVLEDSGFDAARLEELTAEGVF